MTARFLTSVPLMGLRAPFWRLGALLGDGGPGFLLDSGMDPERLGHWSWFGRDPAALLTGQRVGDGSRDMDLVLKVWRGPDGIRHDPPQRTTFRGDPFGALRDLQGRYGVRERTDGPPFAAGLVGYFGYGTAHAIENLPDSAVDDLRLPDLAFMVCDEVLAWDHRTDELTLHVAAAADGAAAVRAPAWEDVLARLDPPAPGVTAPPATAADAVPAPDVRAHFDRAAYMAAVERCRAHIRQGDVFEVCLTHRLEMDLPGTAWELYNALRAINPAPFACFLQLPDFQVVGASPERFLRLDPDRTAESRPIKGTRPRGATPDQDAAIRAELAASEKDLAENIMIVDLVRNDLGRVCEIGSVHVPGLQEVETYATVHQLVSTVRGVLKPQHDAFDLVRACFPGGSMTGAPKIEAMKIIDAIEPVVRGVYSGAIGYLDAGGAMDLGMVIRSIVCKDGVATFGVGGAVVADSDPAAEYEETLDKARALIAAVRGLRDGAAS